MKRCAPRDHPRSRPEPDVLRSGGYPRAPRRRACIARFPGKTVAFGIWLLAVLPLSAAGAGDSARLGDHGDSGDAVLLKDDWSFRIGDDARWSDPSLDEVDWRPVSFPVGWSPSLGEGEFVWYRAAVWLPDRLMRTADLPLAIRIGPVNSAYQVFVGGELLGGVGTIDADPGKSRLDYDSHGLFVVPARLLLQGGRLVVALRVWRDPQTLATVGGPFEGTPEVGRFDVLLHREMDTRVLALVLCLFFAVLGLFHLELFRRIRRDKSFLWLGGLAIGLSMYTLLRSPWKSFLHLDFESAKDLEHVIAFLLIPAFIQFSWQLLGERISPVVRAYQWANAGAAALAALPGLRLNFRLLPIWQAAMLVALCGGAFKVVRRAVDGHSEARIMLPGYIAVATAIANDVLVDRGLYNFARLTPIGFAVLLASFAASVANHLLRSDQEREELNRGLQRASQRTAELAASSEAKSRFLAVMSHEIRTPLNAVLGTNKLLLERPLGPEERALCEGAERSGQALMALIDDVLDFSRIESDHLEFSKEPFGVEAICEEAFDITSPRAAEKGLDFALLLEPALPTRVVGDAVRLRQILVNLMSNAVKFTTTGWIFVEVARSSRASADGISFRITDTGVGIEAENLELIFDRFRQVDSSNSRKYAGVGLGLAICKSLAERMGGAVRVSSRPAEGSTFELWLPLPAAGDEVSGTSPWAAGRTVRVFGLPQATHRCVSRLLEAAGATLVGDSAGDPVLDRRIDAEIEGVSEDSGDGSRTARSDAPPAAVRSKLILSYAATLGAKSASEETRLGTTELGIPIRPSQLRQRLMEIWGVVSHPGERARSESSREHSVARALLRVLVADDDEIGRKISCAMLRNLGIVAELAVDGVEALRRIEAEPYDLVFLDLQMPGLDGIEVARRARASLGIRCPRLVALTANVVRKDREECVAVGIVRFVTKPILPENLLAVVREFELERTSGAMTRGGLESPGELDSQNAAGADRRGNGA